MRRLPDLFLPPSGLLGSHGYLALLILWPRPWQEDTGKPTAGSLWEIFLKSLGRGVGALASPATLPELRGVSSSERPEILLQREFTEQQVRSRCLGSPHLRTQGCLLHLDGSH